MEVPRPGPAKLRPGAGLDEWLEEAKQCHYLPEAVMKQLCEMVKEVLMEGEITATAMSDAYLRLLTLAPKNLISSRFRPRSPSAATYTVNSTICWSCSAWPAVCPGSRMSKRRQPLRTS